MQAGRHLEAQLCCRNALAADPNHRDSLHLMGMLCLQARQYDHAIEWVARANQQDVASDYLFGLATALEQQGLSQEALKAYDRAVQLRPDDAELWAGRGTILHRLGRFDEAIADNSHAHALSPASPDICNNVGASLQLLCRDEEALAWFDKALTLKPDFVMSLINKASSLAQLRRIDEAIAAYEQVKAMDPANTEADPYLALIYLLQGDFERGWAGYIARWNAFMRRESYPDFHDHLWLGKESIDGKTILVFADEGFGDTIHFARYVPMLAARGAKVVLVVEEPLRPLLARLEGVVQCLPKPASSFPPFDLHCPICMLPLAFGTRLDTIPAAPSYLPPPAQTRVRAWERRLSAHAPAGNRPRVGLVWSGNPRHSNDHNRSIALRVLSPLLDADVSFVSLQKDARPQDTALLPASGIIDLTAEITDFTDTAALMSCLDLVISVDTSAAHLAAALGRPTWILLPYLPDSRWLLDRDDSPWYPTARLFRQSARRDWAEVIERVRRALHALVAG
ncbi:MAG: glycosyltransferase family protein [Bradyrhizobium sp.]|nr:glycosyltransferase family protein [Bradyrhizobium sp.]